MPNFKQRQMKENIPLQFCVLLSFLKIEKNILFFFILIYSCWHEYITVFASNVKLAICEQQARRTNEEKYTYLLNLTPRNVVIKFCAFFSQ